MRARTAVVYAPILFKPIFYFYKGTTKMAAINILSEKTLNEY